MDFCVNSDCRVTPPGMHLAKSEALGLQLVQLLTKQLHGAPGVQGKKPTTSH